MGKKVEVWNGDAESSRGIEQQHFILGGTASGVGGGHRGEVNAGTGIENICSGPKNERSEGGTKIKLTRPCVQAR